MPRSRRPLVPLATLFARAYPDLDVATEVRAHRVSVDGRPVTNPDTRVRPDASIRVAVPRRLRGEVKLGHALQAFDIAVTGRTCADIGASTGGFTSALLLAGAARVYALDTAVGQLLGRLRADPRVVNLEGTNLGALAPGRVPEPVGLITVDLSYLSLAAAIPQLDVLRPGTGTDLVALVKPTFELHSATVASTRDQVAAAVAAAGEAMAAAGWTVVATTPAPRTGRRGSVEEFVHARREGARREGAQSDLNRLDTVPGEP